MKEQKIYPQLLTFTTVLMTHAFILPNIIIIVDIHNNQVKWHELWCRLAGQLMLIWEGFLV